jgi:lipopolysaccharide export system protein LptA
MSAQKASAPAKFAAWAAAAALVVLTVAVGLRLAGRREGDRPAAAVKPPPGAAAIDIKERVRHEEYMEGKLHAAIQGERFSLGPDGRNHLEGAVEVRNYDPAGRVVSLIRADHIVYDKNAVLFAIGGRVRVEAEGVVLEGGSFEYDKSRGLFRTAAGGVFSSENMTGAAREISYSESADEVLLAGGFRVELNGTDSGAAKAVLSGDSLSYQRRGRRGRAVGRVAFTGGRCRGSAASLDFDIAEGSSLLKNVVFDGAAKLVIAGAGMDRAESGEVRADKVQAAFFPGSRGLFRAEALGHSRLSWPLSPASKSLIQAGRAVLTFGAGEQLERLDASGGCRAELDDDAGKGRLLEGESISYDALTGILLASGEEGRPAVASSSDARIEAPDIAVGPAAGDLEASSGVMCLLKPDGERRAGGFFSDSEPVFLSCSRLTFLAETGAFSFFGGVRAWQGGDFVMAGELDLMEKSRDMWARGHVVAGLAQVVAAGGPERRVEAGGEDMTYSTASRALSFTRKSYLRLPDARLDAETVAVGLGLEEGGVETVTAHRGVVLSKGGYEGRAEAAVYQTEADRITLTGRPVLVDREGGSTRGDKLTFDLGDDKILIENEGQGRSTTIVKS